MSKYSYRTGNVERPSCHFGSKVVSLGIGAFIGFYSGAMVVVGEIQASTPIVTQDTPSSLSVQPVTVQQFSDVTEPSDIQPALGVGMVQVAMPDRNYQPAQVAGQYQPAARDGVYQHTVTDYQLQGEQLKLN